jgi:hypothetical protein
MDGMSWVAERLVIAAPGADNTSPDAAEPAR